MGKISAAVAAALAAFLLAGLAAKRLVLEPTFFAVFYWGNSLNFALGLLAIFLLVLYRLLKAYRPIASHNKAAVISRAALLGFGLGLLAAAILAGRVNRPVPLAWFKPAAVSERKLSEHKLAARRHRGREHVNEHVHDHGGPNPGKVDGGKLVELDRLARLHARSVKKPILYYFRADWCPNCPDFERYVLASPVFAAALRDFVLVKMDVTDFEKLRAYVDRNFGVHGTPTVVFRDRRGRIVSGATVNGAHVSYRLFGRLLEMVKRSKGPGTER